VVGVVARRTIGDTRDVFNRLSSFYETTFECLAVQLN
jgi:hypothetical protein